MLNLDQRLLEIFERLYLTGSVSKTSDMLAMGQPAVSIALTKLREHFNDPLFVRIKNKMEATSLAHELYPVAKQALEGLKAVQSFTQRFDAKTATRSFAISMTDITHMVLLPKLWAHFKQVAPHIKLEVYPIGRETADKLASGEVDLAIGFLPQLEAGFYQQTLFRQNYICLVSKKHPRIKKSLSLQHYQTEGHVSIVTSGTGHMLLDAEVKRLQLQRRIDLKLPSFLGIGYLIEHTELIASVPEKLGELLAQSNKIHCFPLPFALPDYAVKQHWHERFHADKGSQWLRETIMNLLT